MQNELKSVLNALEFAKAIGTGVNRVRALVKQGRIKHVKYGKNIRIPLHEVSAFLERELQGGN
jgi:excisionase family DNA binding protein